MMAGVGPSSISYDSFSSSSELPFTKWEDLVEDLWEQDDFEEFSECILAFIQEQSYPLTSIWHTPSYDIMEYSKSRNGKKDGLALRLVHDHSSLLIFHYYQGDCQGPFAYVAFGEYCVKGMAVAGKLHGPVRIESLKGDISQFMMFEGKVEGKMCVHFANNGGYGEIECVGGKYHGLGIHALKDGSVLISEWKNHIKLPILYEMHRRMPDIGLIRERARSSEPNIAILSWKIENVFNLSMNEILGRVADQLALIVEKPPLKMPLAYQIRLVEAPADFQCLERGEKAWQDVNRMLSMFVLAFLQKKQQYLSLLHMLDPSVIKTINMDLTNERSIVQITLPYSFDGPSHIDIVQGKRMYIGRKNGAVWQGHRVTVTFDKHVIVELFDKGVKRNLGKEIYPDQSVEFFHCHDYKKEGRAQTRSPNGDLRTYSYCQDVRSDTILLKNPEWPAFYVSYTSSSKVANVYWNVKIDSQSFALQKVLHCLYDYFKKTERPCLPVPRSGEESSEWEVCSSASLG